MDITRRHNPLKMQRNRRYYEQTLQRKRKAHFILNIILLPVFEIIKLKGHCVCISLTCIFNNQQRFSEHIRRLLISLILDNKRTFFPPESVGLHICKYTFIYNTIDGASNVFYFHHNRLVYTKIYISAVSTIGNNRRKSKRKF